MHIGQVVEYDGKSYVVTQIQDSDAVADYVMMRGDRLLIALDRVEIEPDEICGI